MGKVLWTASQVISCVRKICKMVKEEDQKYKDKKKSATIVHTLLTKTLEVNTVIKIKTVKSLSQAYQKPFNLSAENKPLTQSELGFFKNLQK